MVSKPQLIELQPLILAMPFMLSSQPLLRLEPWHPNQPAYLFGLQWTQRATVMAIIEFNQLCQQQLLVIIVANKSIQLVLLELIVRHQLMGLQQLEQRHQAKPELQLAKSKVLPMLNLSLAQQQLELLLTLEFEPTLLEKVVMHQ